MHLKFSCRTSIRTLATLTTGIMLASSAVAETIAIRAGHVIEPGTDTVLDRQVIRVADGKIVSMEPDGQSLPDADQVIDLGESWVLPGLMDAHVHLTANYEYGHPNYKGGIASQSESFRALRGAHNAGLFLQAGFTTVKEIGNDGDYITAGIIKGIDQGWVEGPTIIYAGKIIAPYGGQMGGYTAQYEGAWHYEYIDADSPAEMVKAIRKNMYFGATTIKLAVDQLGYFYSLEEMQAAVNEAHRLGLTLTAHTMGGEAARNVILSGADGIEHGFELDEELLNLMKKQGTYLVGTDFSAANWRAYNDQDEARVEKLSASMTERLKLAYKIGVPMAFGTDVIVDQVDKNRVESSLSVLETWKAAGIPPMAILQAMTANAARLMKIQEQRGSLKAGLQADIIALSQNPLEDIDYIRSVHFVMKNGKVVRNGEPRPAQVPSAAKP